MANFKFENVKIKGISTVIPEKELSLLNEPNLYNGDLKRINRVINSSGFLKRRVADEDVMTSDLCLQAAEDLMKNLNIKREEIDALIFISYTPDYLMPATSYVLYKKLGLSQNCICMDIPQACSGYVLGLFQSSMLLNAGCKKVLLLVGDCISKFSDMFIDNTAPIFGDAGSATLVEYDKLASPTYFSINSDGNEYDAILCKQGGFRNRPKPSDFYENGEYKYEAKMNGGKVFDFTMNNVVPSIESLLKYSNINIDQIDILALHQANKFILENIARKLNVSPSRISTETLTNYGNQTGASIPCTISNVYREEVSGKKKKYLLSGFGAGISWANAIIDIGEIYCSKLNVYKKGEKDDSNRVL